MYYLCWLYVRKGKDTILPTEHVGLQDRLREVGAKLRQELACSGAGDGWHERRSGW